MTNRERALKLLHFEKPDRMPAVHFGYWRELLEEWEAAKLIPSGLAEAWGDGKEADKELDRILGWDFGWGACAPVNNGLYPEFEQIVLEVLPDGMQRVQSSQGIIEKVKPGVSSIPAEDDYQLKDRKAFEELYLPKMQFTPDRVDLDYFRSFNETHSYDTPIGIAVGSVLGSIRNMTSVMGMSYLLYDEDETLFADIVDTYAEMQYKCLETVLATGAKFDFAHFWEDICFKNGPLLAPDTFRELCFKHYKKRCDLCHRYGIDIISLDCDGVIGKLIPIWYEAGVNTMFPMEVGVWGDQFEGARNEHGKGLLGIGGMDKTALRRDKADVDEEVRRMEKLTALGGFIPCPDHRLMPGTKIDLVKYYADEIKKIKV